MASRTFIIFAIRGTPQKIKGIKRFLLKTLAVIKTTIKQWFQRKQNMIMNNIV